MISAGELDQRIDILSTIETPAAIGGVDTGFALLRAVWAKPMEGLGKEFVAAGNVEAQRKVAFKTRWAADIYALAERARIGWQGLLFEVVNVTGTQRSGEMWLQCQSIGVYS